MAILLAANSPEVRLVGLTTVYGNVPTALATANALRLLEMAGLGQVGQLMCGEGHGAWSVWRCRSVAGWRAEGPGIFLAAQCAKLLGYGVVGEKREACVLSATATRCSACDCCPCCPLSSCAQDVVVAQGAARSLKAGMDVERIADFVHGADGFGDIGLPPPKVGNGQGCTPRDHGGACVVD